MTQLALSHDLSVITTEIIAYKGMLAQNVFEIGARLKHVRDNNLAHGQWERWCDEECGISPRNARRYIRVYERFSNRTHVADLNGLRKMDMLSEFSDEELEEPVQLPSGETKKLLQMSTSEIEQYKRAKAEAERRAKEAEERAAKAENEARHWQNVAKSAQNQPPRIITNTVEKIPDHIKKKIEEDEIKLRTLKSGLEEAQREIERLKLQDTVEFDELQSQLQRKKLQHEADMEALQLSIVYKQFIEKAAIGSYQLGALAVADPTEKKRLLERIEIAQKILNDTKLALQGRMLGGVINE